MISAILNVKPLGFVWETQDPFLFCVHHNDAYPRGNDTMGPVASLAGRDIGMDFAGLDGWRMYHGRTIPGFPRHPHRGFETVTLARRGFIDHSDSLGATARFGQGDVQWMTAGRGIEHAEMFPLRQREQPNPLELFQIWLNLPRADKMVEPYFTMLWAHQIPRQVIRDAHGRTAELTVVAGAIPEMVAPPSPPPNSWAARPDADVAIWTVRLEPQAAVTLPPARAGTHRTVYFFRGSKVTVFGQAFGEHRAIEVNASVALPLVAGDEEVELLVLQGRPIGEPVVQHGPFVMNSAAEIQQAFADYRRMGFGEWPWASDDPVHPREHDRFAIHADGRREQAEPAES